MLNIAIGNTRLVKSDLSLFYLLVFVLLIMGCDSDAKREYSDDAPRRIEILFLGHDQEHHHSRVYSPILAAALTKEGINITYTEDVYDLKPSYLGNFDAVILYANHEDSYPDQEKALLEYVEAGHGFVPIHCASFCFKDSPAYVELVGAQFKEHGTGIFTAQIIDTIHPAAQNLTEFSTWDETYVHGKIADDIQILMERNEGDHHEPWTWTKRYGKGRVFYTAYGHDERTWTNVGFQNLVKEGILWVVSDQVKANWKAFSRDIPTLTYEARDSIPNYEKRDPPLKYQLPLSPAQSAKLIQVPPGFDLQLFASEPDVINPIAMNWDERGRLWVIETVDYPNTIRDDKGAGDDCIKILEDTDGDGHADKVTIFAEHLNIPTSFTFVDGGLLVSQAPHFIFLKDTDGDDRADIREIILDGWGTFDTHAGPSNLQYATDNRIHGVVGYSGFKGSIFARDYAFGQGTYSLDIREKTFEFLTNTSNNTWGLGFTEDYAMFASTANNTHSVFLGIPNRYLTDIQGISMRGNEKIDGHYNIQPITPNVRQVDVFGGFTAAAGHHFYTARTFPRSYWNQTAFVCEPTGGLVHIANIQKDGAGYREEDGGNLLASSDEWVSPVEAKVGPDGAVWVADWYNFIVQHNPTPRLERGGYDAENGDGNAYVNPLRDKSRGRIWRIAPKGNDGDGPRSLDKEDPHALIIALTNDNMFWRLTAQRLIVDRSKSDVLPELYKMAAKPTLDELSMDASSLHALWTIDGLVQLSSNPDARDAVLTTLTHPAAAVRKAAIQILPKDAETDAALLQQDVLEDNAASVQLAALLYFAERPPSDVIGEILYQLSNDTALMEDPWLAKALYIAACKHRSGFLNTFRKNEPNKIDALMSQEQKQDVAYDDRNWDLMTLPQSIEQAGVNIDGIIWFRKTIDLTPGEVGREGTISLGPIDDSDIVYINGVKVGATKDGSRINRVYDFGSHILTAGKNVVAIKVEDTRGSGGLVGTEDQLVINVGNMRIPLDGRWKYEVEADFSTGFTAFRQQTMGEVLYQAYQHGANTMDLAQVDKTEATTIHINTIKNEMKYDVTEFVVEAGKTVEIVLENVDFMQHNLVIVQRGSAEKVGTAADALATDPRGEATDYIPDLDEVLFATELVDPQEKAVLTFTVPFEPGDYPFICTFPGHWRIMQGVMKVIPRSSNEEL